jgi:hypothetical protein
MNYKEHLSKLIKLPLILTSVTLLSLAGCDSSDDDGDSVGYFQIYNASPTAPAIYLTVDQEDDDSYDETTHTGVEYTSISSRLTYETDTYDIELAWKDEDYDLDVIHESQLTIQKNYIKFIVVSEDIKAANIQVFDIAVRDDDEISEDSDDDLFNIRFLNMHEESNSIDIYMSESDETFNEAELVGQTVYGELSDSQKMDEDSYIFYVTYAGSEEILFTSTDISFPYSSEYLIAVRENKGAGNSPFVIDVITTSSISEYADVDSEAAFRIFNGITEHELLPSYTGLIDLHVDGIDDSAEVSSLAFNEFSEKINTDFGDYSVSLVSSDDNSPIIENHLLTLNENSDKTIFFYLTEDNVDDDGDGNVDEDGDGIVDEIEISINSLVVNNSQNESIYTHQINVVNLIDSDDFSTVNVYFVRSNEIIGNAENSVGASYIVPNSITLINNTYTVYVVSTIKSSEVIISASELILDEDSKDQFLILETDADSATGYKASFTNQMVD